MNKEKRAKLEANGWKVGTVAEFLELTPEENEFIETRLILSKALKQRRTTSNLTQEVMARKIHSSQSRLAKMEAGDPSVTIDLLIKGLLASGANRKQLGQILLEAEEV